MQQQYWVHIETITTNLPGAMVAAAGTTRVFEGFAYSSSDSLDVVSSSLPSPPPAAPPAGNPEAKIDYIIQKEPTRQSFLFLPESVAMN